MTEDRSKYARQSLGLTVPLPLKVHPEQAAHLQRRAEEEYCSMAEYVRRLITADMRIITADMRNDPEDRDG